MPQILQNESCECGAASLGMILGYYGRYDSIINLREACKVSKDGCSVFDIVTAAEQYGLIAEAYQIDAALTGVSFPCIGFWKGYHFIVIEGVSDKNVYVCDPAIGHRELEKEEFARYFSKVIVTFKKGEDFQKGGKPFRETEYIWNLISNKKNALLFMGVLSVLSHVLGLIIPEMERLFMDRYLDGNFTADLSQYFLAFAGFLFVQIFVLEFQKHVMINFERVQSAELSRYVIKKILSLPFDYFQKRNHSTTEAKLMAINDLTDFLTNKVISAMFDLVFSVIYLVMLFRYSIPIALVVSAVISAILLILNVFMSGFRNMCIRGKNEMNKFYSEIYQNVKLFDTIKSTASENYSMKKTMYAYYSYENVMNAAKNKLSVVQVIPVIVPVFLQMIVLILGTYLASAEALTLGKVAACQSLAVFLFIPLSNFVMNLNDFQNHVVTISTLKDVKEEKRDRAIARSSSDKERNFEGRIEIKNLVFGYNPSMPPVIKNVSVSVEPGESVAFVGSSGCGKSTLLQLVEGLYLPWKGEIIIDNEPFMETDRKLLADHIAVVAQKPTVIYGTINQNIALLDSKVTASQIEQAAKDACIYHDIMKKEKGFNTILDPLDIDMSGGQIQRLMLARALVKNPAVIILDEATSALDTLTEKEVMDHIKKRNITVLIVAHRLSTIRDCNKIIVLDKGKIVEQGVHNDLLEIENGIYKKLVSSGANDSYAK